jgi:hypothetical protein
MRHYFYLDCVWICKFIVRQSKQRDVFTLVEVFDVINMFETVIAQI